jgi:hypothetical protein
LLLTVLGWLHRNMGLVSKLKFLGLPNLVNVLVLLLFFVLLTVGVASHLGGDLHNQGLEVLKQLV